MTEQKISAFLKARTDAFSPAPVIYRKGSVERVGDGVVHVKNLPGRKYGELLEFGSGVYGMALDLTEDGVGAVLLDAEDSVCAGETVKGTGRVAEVPVGDVLLGRVIDPIGRPLDERPLDAVRFYPVERPAPAIMDRRPVDTPLETGILAIDSMIPIGRGQRELIIGDRQTGKTAIAVDAIINQKNTDVICVYCAVGQKSSTVAGVIETLRQAGAMDYSVVVHAGASDSPAIQYLAPFAACSIAEYFAERGRDVLVVYDDLSKHAVAYRTMTLLLLRPPGREAFPGDIFYLHSRLLERAACLSEEKGGGTVTALPIVETMAGNISSYIPTNIISITDGQIYLESELFHAGVRPAVNTGLSVSRVGRSAQSDAMKAVSGTLRIDLSQYREMAVFTRFGSDLDSFTSKLLRRGETLMNLFKQDKSKPYTLFEEVAVLLGYEADAFRDTAMKDLRKTVADYLTAMKQAFPDEASAMNATGAMDADLKARLLQAAEAFREGRTL